tara:strand:- start:325 stop:468 length:144 start_codon:yes stop_codon:yes gene_type:complete
MAKGPQVQEHHDGANTFCRINMRNLLFPAMSLKKEDPSAEVAGDEEA